MQFTVVSPIANVLPDGGTQVTGTSPSTESKALTVNETIAPCGPVALAVTVSGSVNTGGMMSAAGRSDAAT